MDPTLHEVLKIRLAHSQSATKKFDALQRRSLDGRIHDTLQFCGASRTGRWAGRGLQLQNLKRPTLKETDWAADLLVKDPKLFGLLFDLEDLGSLIRSAIKAPESKALVVADLASIESRVLGWLSADPKLQAVFAEGKDPYKAFAEDWLGTPYDQVDKATRNLCKPPTLGCGYGLSAKGLVKYADSMGVEMTEDVARSAVEAFRFVYGKVPEYWSLLEQNWAQTVIHEIGHGKMALQDRFLTIELPSGRKLYYDQPGYNDGSCEFQGQDQYTTQWGTIRTWGGKLCENVTQAVARDVLAHGMQLYTEEGGTIIGHVHDEIIAEEDADHAKDWLILLKDCMSVTPPWAPGLRLAAEGYVSSRYRKD